MEHFLQVLTKRKLLHTKNNVHRDLRIENVLLVKNVAYLNDLGFALPINDDRVTEPCYYEGLIETASYYVLVNYKSGTEFPYRKIDDIESSFICFMLWYYQIPFQFYPGVSRSEQAFQFWEGMLLENSLLTEYENAASLLRSILKCVNGELRLS